MKFIAQQIKHDRILQVREKLLNGATEEEIIDFCLNYLKVSKPTAVSYFNDAAKLIRKIFELEQLQQRKDKIKQHKKNHIKECKEIIKNSNGNCDVGIKLDYALGKIEMIIYEG